MLGGIDVAGKTVEALVALRRPLREEASQMSNRTSEVKPGKPRRTHDVHQHTGGKDI